MWFPVCLHNNCLCIHPFHGSKSEFSHNNACGLLFNRKTKFWVEAIARLYTHNHGNHVVYWNGLWDGSIQYTQPLWSYLLQYL